MIQNCLRKVNNDIEKALDTGKLDFASESHLASCQSRIERILKPELDEYDGF